MMKLIKLSVLLLVSLFAICVHASFIDEALTMKKQTVSRAPAATGFYQKHRLVYFFASTCPYCHSFSPILASYASKQGADVLALSIDGKGLPDFPQFKVADTDWLNLAFAGREMRYPALFILNEHNKSLYPISFGTMNEQELVERLEIMQGKITAYEARGQA